MKPILITFLGKFLIGIKHSLFIGLSCRFKVSMTHHPVNFIDKVH